MHIKYDNTKLHTTARAKVGLVAALAQAVTEADPPFNIPWDKRKADLPSRNGQQSSRRTPPQAL
eukprot:7905517-Heterocapsa_arctica.AAC.1